ncbi:VCBS repeat-containing protein [Nannocystis sp.]|uniref:FG-GAP repeat domain-containing protein n=1 Tax=Nannocystis sp. TaxID=1962667 RepID=UPI00242534E3|nr:VCBS repeat-containing protein [Nannocystis sp.]MBK7827500.1 VCBS repeat-containing protein [Nannocystis sp.]MBK9756380.1 VCBS repeat-containing protein [Nannocystis sp.]
MSRPGPRTGLLALMLAACGDASSASDSAASTGPTTVDPTNSPTSAPTSGPTPTTGATTGGVTEGVSATGGETSGGIKFDLQIANDINFDSEGPPPSCKVVDDMNAIGSCKTKAPPDSFEPEVQWSWGQANVEGGSTATPLVANLTDDNNDGAIDLCDIPDVVVVAGGGGGLGGKLYVLDGATGTLHFAAATPIESWVTPAIGDIDNDGLPEIVAATPGGFINPSGVVAFEHDGTLKWSSTDKFNHDQGGSIALGDLDNDGDVEIVADDLVLDHNGKTIFIAPEQALWDIAYHCTATALADLDGDGDLEIVLGQAAYHHDGKVYYNNPQLKPGFPQIANLDPDPEPEILLTNINGITVIEHDGKVKFNDIRPTGDPPGAWFRPATVHDFDGDAVSEFAVSSAAHYSVFEPGGKVSWTANVQDGSGWAAGTAFDFDGDGVAEAMYADEATLFVFDGKGAPLLSVPRSSKTLIEYPVVADVDNDGSAEIVVVSDLDFNGNQTSPTVQVIRDKQDRWIQARRIWNQHTYHVTNVREDGTIPQFEPPSWQSLNTYRTNAQIEGGSLCKPEPPG